MTEAERREQLQRATLREHLGAVERSVVALRHSLAKCRGVGVKPEYALDELDHFEALSARFARTSDLYTQKLLKSLFLVLREDAVAFLDKARLAEQLAIIDNADDLAAIRDLRNTIAHEYSVANLNEVFRRTLELTDTLLEIIESTRRYIGEKVPLPPRDRTAP
ncbi:MAG: hypothetical protein FJ387_26115 [Verrucomicrobia bacterium]|nr:hypothetical protein [Verrucomicrobiota bacterium]